MPPIPSRSLLASFVLAVSMQASASAPLVSPLEQLLLDKNYPAFHASVGKEVAAGKVEALFLLGKAKHLGLGTKVDLPEAERLYKQALALGSARAAHNLGTIKLDADEREPAIAFFKQALAFGLNTPTLFNLGKAYSPSPPRYPDQLEGGLLMSEEAAGYFVRAYEADRSVDTAARAGREFVQMVDFMRLQKQYGIRGKPRDRPAIRALAVKWLKVAMDQGSAAATTNYGSLLQMEGNEAEARAQFVKGAAGGNAMAHYKLGMMEEKSAGGTDAASLARALAHYVSAVRLGMKDASDDVRRMVPAQFHYNSPVKALEVKLLADQLAQLPAEEFGEMAKAARRLLSWLVFRDAEHAYAMTLPALPLRLQACGLLNGQKFERPDDVVEGEFRLLVLARGERDAIPTGVEGVTRNGCATLHVPLPAKLRKMVAEGAILALGFPTIWLPLKMEVGQREIALVLHPLSAPLPRYDLEH